MAHYKGSNNEAGRAIKLAKKREQEQLDVELQRQRIHEQLEFQSIEEKFSSTEEKSSISGKSYGLFTLDELKKKQELDSLSQKPLEEDLKVKTRTKHEQAKRVQKLSFDINENEEELTDEAHFDNLQPSMKKVRKNPHVDTSFLRDRERDEEEMRIRDGLKREWLEKQTAIKNEFIDVTFSYYDGSNHRFSITMMKGNTIAEFLQAALEKILRSEFLELRRVSNDQLMYIKEDLILPYHYTFYDFIIRKARGKSGPLFLFDVRDDVRLVSDSSVEKEESHAGKIVLRSWYEKNKHIFPASRWEPYDPSKTFTVYTVKDTSK